MDLAQFKQTLSQSRPPEGMPPLLQALWWDGRGDWERAHLVAQDEQGIDAAWVHAYLHRKEGDEWFAGYWYRQAGKTQCAAPLELEWIEIVTALLLANSS
jgi:hypothetical protein